MVMVSTRMGRTTPKTRDLGLNMSDFEDEVVPQVPASKQVLRHINAYMEHHKLTWDWNGAIVQPSGDKFDLETLADRIWVQRNFGFAKPRYVAALKGERDKAQAEMRQALRDSIIEMPLQSDGALRFAVRAVVEPETDEDTFEYYVQAVSQLIWNIKRRILGKPTNWEIFLMLYSETNGSGKSSWMRAFGAILKDWLVTDGDFDLFKDQFSKRAFTDYYLIIFDEMSRGDPKLLGSIKNMITKDTVANRAMYSDTLQNKPRTATLMGASNKPITEHIEDSGMRRWVQMNFIEAPLVDGQGHSVLMREIDWAGVWAGVDANAESPYARNAELFRRHQRHLETRGSPEFLAIIAKVLMVTNDETDVVTLSDVWDKYKQVAELVGYAGYKTFCRDMSLYFHMYKVRRNFGNIFHSLKII